MDPGYLLPGLLSSGGGRRVRIELARIPFPVTHPVAAHAHRRRVA